MGSPRIAITLGDPAGVGPETIVGAWSDPAVHEFCRPLVVGHPEIVRRAVRAAEEPRAGRRNQSLLNKPSRRST